MESRMDKPILCNELIGALTNPKRSLRSYAGGSIAEGTVRKLKTQLVQAQKFVVSDSLVDEVVSASMSKPSVLDNMAQIARPPFTNMWIEWNEGHRIKALKDGYDKYLTGTAKKLMSDHPPLREHFQRIGFWIHQYSDETDAYTMIELFFKNEKDGTWFSPPLCTSFKHDEELVYSPYEHYIHSQGILKNQPKENTYRSREEYYRDTYGVGMSLWGNLWEIWQYNQFNPTLANSLYEKVTTREDLPELADIYLNIVKDMERSLHTSNPNEMDYMKRIACRCGTVQSASMGWLIPKKIYQRGYTQQQMQEMTKSYLDLVQGGDMRFIISLLSILNYEKVIYQKEEPAKNKIDHIQQGRRVPTNEYKIVTINLPKPRGKKIYEKLFTGHGTPQREHLRSGHWRRFRDRYGNITKKTWISEYKAGNPKLGTLIHDYNLEKGND